ncbi:MAG: DNA primase [Bacillota bacterium]
MRGLLPEELVAEVGARIDLVHLVAEYMHLEKRGRNYVGLCPFHQEKTPSFTVTPEKQLFYCFGCGVGGNAFKFLMLKENISFPEAVRRLAARVGITVPVGPDPESGEKERIRRAHLLASRFYRDVLLNHPAAAEARRYLDGRGISPELQERFGLGYAPPQWDALINYLQKQGYAPGELVAWGLAAQGDRGVYDRFRGRIIFPIADARGRVVGFGGRVLDSGREKAAAHGPKYLNSPETVLFNKSSVLYGLHLARESIRERGYAVLVEGYIDVITAHRYGVTNAVAPLGTSLTREQGRLLMGYAMDAVIAFDADVAGVAATIRGLDLLQELGCRVKVVTLPQGTDPDEFLRREGPEAWEALVAGAVPLIEYKLAGFLSGRRCSTAAEKLAALRHVLPNLKVLRSAVEREEGIRTVERMLSLSWETIHGELKKFVANQSNVRPNSDKIANKIHNIVIKERRNVEHIEAGLLRLLLEDAGLLPEIRAELGDTFFRHPGYQRILDTIIRLGNDVLSPATLSNYLGEEEQNLLSALLAGEPPPGDRKRMAQDYIAALKRWQRRDRRQQLLADLVAADRAGDGPRVARLLLEIKEIDACKAEAKGG